MLACVAGRGYRYGLHSFAGDTVGISPCVFLVGIFRGSNVRSVRISISIWKTENDQTQKIKGRTEKKVEKNKWKREQRGRGLGVGWEDMYCV